DQATYTARFGPTVDADTLFSNLDFHGAKISVTYLPLSLLRLYCDDCSKNITPEANNLANGTVFGSLKAYYTLAQLQAPQPDGHDLWNRLSDRIKSLGGCGNLPP